MAYKGSVRRVGGYFSRESSRKNVYLKTENQPMSAFECFIIQMLKVRVGNREKQNGAV
jgi:hypothetical protein